MDKTHLTAQPTTVSILLEVSSSNGFILTEAKIDNRRKAVFEASAIAVFAVVRLHAKAEVILAEESIALERHEANVSFILRWLAKALYKVRVLWTVFTGDLEDLRRGSRRIQGTDGSGTKR
jgi:hypothetical protein